MRILPKAITCACLIACNSLNVAHAQDDIEYRNFNGDLASILPSLYGGDGVTLFAAEVHDHSAHFSGAALNSLNQLTNGLGGILTPSFYISHSLLYEYDQISEEFLPIRVEENPIIGTDSPFTIGAGKTGFGVSFNERSFDSLNGARLNDLMIDLGHLELAGPGADICAGGPPGQCHLFELDVVRLNVDVKFRERSMFVGMTHGLTDTIDLSISAPVLDTSLSVKSTAEIIAHETSENVPFTIHRFDPQPGSDQPFDAARGDHQGLGDVSIKLKKNLDFFGEDLGLAIAGTVRLPTGSQENFQGLPNIGFEPCLILSKRWSFLGMDMRSNANFAYLVNATQSGSDVSRIVVSSSFNPKLKIADIPIFASAGINSTMPIGDRAFMASSIETVHHDGSHGSDSHHYGNFLEPNQNARLDGLFGVHAEISEGVFLSFNSDFAINDPGLRSDLSHSLSLQFPF